MTNNQTEYFYTVSSEGDLGDLLEGREAGRSVKWKPPVSTRVSSGMTGVLWKRRQVDRPIIPLAIVVQRSDLRRLCARFSQLRSHLSPLTAWCHLLSPHEFEVLEAFERTPDFQGFAGAWTGLIVAEAHLLAKRSVSDLRISACLATQSFAVARATVIWDHTSPNSVIERYDAVNKLMSRNVIDRGDSSSSMLREALFTIWDSLAASTKRSAAHSAGEVDPIGKSLVALLGARERKDDASGEVESFARPLLETVPEARELMGLEHLTSQQRLQLFDNMANNLMSSDPNRAQARSRTVPLLLGYLATVVAGGEPSISLTEQHARRWPEILAWAYVVGGVGQSVLWNSSFDGLGRLVARELTRSFRLDDAPTCDFALDEGKVLADPELKDPLVHVRIKQAKVVTIALIPGVNILVPVGDFPDTGHRKPTSRGRDVSPGVHGGARLNSFAVLADALWPHIRRRVVYTSEELIRKRWPPASRKRGRQSGSTATIRGQETLPLKTKD